MRSSFPQGVVVFFRHMSPDVKNFANSVHPSGRRVDISDMAEDYVIFDEEDRILGIFPREYVAAILPLQTTGPGVVPNANNPSLNS